MEAKIQKIEIEKKSFRIFSTIMILLICATIFLIQFTDRKKSDERLNDQILAAQKEAKAESERGNILSAVNNSEEKVTTLTAEVKGYRSEVVTNTKLQEKSLNNFNELKSQNEKVYIPSATVNQQTDFISNYKYEPIGAN